MQSLLNKYLWQGKRARCAFSKLIKRRNAGGMGHVHIQDYYFASILAQLKHWFSPHANTPWKELELSQIPHGNLPNFLMTAPSCRSLSTTLAPPILASVRAWMYLRANTKEVNGSSPLKLIAALKLLIPNITINKWVEGGIEYLEDVMVGGAS